MRILLAAGVIRAGVRYPATMLPTEQSIEAHLALISCENRKKPCGNDYASATVLRYRMRMDNAYPTQDEFTAALEAKGFRSAPRSSVVMRFNPCCGEYRPRRAEPIGELRDSAEEMPLGVPRG